ncbi:hypothetical protein [Actinomadura coerulea]|uniref:hypothetical protein n=1 Tax=Actinomadura coerulea TaxID=46159 RepID=UPI003431F6F8
MTAQRDTSVRNDWYTSADWDDAARDLFDAKIRRSRRPGSKWQYFRSKANALFFSKDPGKLAAAIALLGRALVEVPGIEPDWASGTYHRLGEFAEAAADLGAAEAYYRQAIAACPLSDRILVGRSCPEEDLARLLNAHGTQQAEQEAEQLFDSLYEHRARHGAWLPRVAELRPIKHFDEAYEDPDDAAEAIVIYHHTEPGMNVLFRPDRRALAALDMLFVGPRRPRAEYHEDFLRKFAGELGAYLGRVVMHEAGGRWRAASPLVDSRVVLSGGREVDPFAAGFKAVWYERSLVRLFDTLVARS